MGKEFEQCFCLCQFCFFFFFRIAVPFQVRKNINKNWIFFKKSLFNGFKQFSSTVLFILGVCSFSLLLCFYLILYFLSVDVVSTEYQWKNKKKSIRSHLDLFWPWIHSKSGKSLALHFILRLTIDEDSAMIVIHMLMDFQLENCHLFFRTVDFFIACNGVNEQIEYSNGPLSPQRKSDTIPVHCFSEMVVQWKCFYFSLF